MLAPYRYIFFYDHSGNGRLPPNLPDKAPPFSPSLFSKFFNFSKALEHLRAIYTQTYLSIVVIHSAAAGFFAALNASL